MLLIAEDLKMPTLLADKRADTSKVVFQVVNPLS
jgi:hypothetical protein